MHDSLPRVSSACPSGLVGYAHTMICVQGDLEELLGKVPPWTPSQTTPVPAGQIPDLGKEAGHPYHLVVV